MSSTRQRRLVTIGTGLVVVGWVIALVLFLTHREGRGRFVDDSITAAAIVGVMTFVRVRTRDVKVPLFGTEVRRYWTLRRPSDWQSVK